MACVQTQAAAAALPPSTSKAVVFLLDASNSMTVNDQERLAKDGIAQLLYSLPSHYRVGFAAYNTSVVSSVGMMDSNAREPVMEAVDAVSYTGYTNAGAGLAAGLALLDTVETARIQGIRIHVIGLGAKMADGHNTTFSASAQTRGTA